MTLQRIKIGQYVHCPNGIGRVWEVYWEANKCGVLLDGESWPQFFSLTEIKPYQGTKQ